MKCITNNKLMKQFIAIHSFYLWQNSFPTWNIVLYINETIRLLCKGKLLKSFFSSAPSSKIEQKLVLHQISKVFNATQIRKSLLKGRNTTAVWYSAVRTNFFELSVDSVASTSFRMQKRIFENHSLFSTLHFSKGRTTPHWHIYTILDFIKDIKISVQTCA